MPSKPNGHHRDRFGAGAGGWLVPGYLRVPELPHSAFGCGFGRPPAATAEVDWHLRASFSSAARRLASILALTSALSPRLVAEVGCVGGLRAIFSFPCELCVCLGI